MRRFCPCASAKPNGSRSRGILPGGKRIQPHIIPTLRPHPRLHPRKAMGIAARIRGRAWCGDCPLAIAKLCRFHPLPVHDSFSSSRIHRQMWNYITQGMKRQSHHPCPRKGQPARIFAPALDNSSRLWYAKKSRSNYPASPSARVTRSRPWLLERYNAASAASKVASALKPHSGKQATPNEMVIEPRD